VDLVEVVVETQDHMLAVLAQQVKVLQVKLDHLELNEEAVVEALQLQLLTKMELMD
jgi:hypothetical protein